jgi:hypothetical protein
MHDRQSITRWLGRPSDYRLISFTAVQGGAQWIGDKMPGAPSFKYFNVAIASPDKAVEATTKYLAKGKVDAEHVAASTARELSSAEVAALRLKAGEVKPAWAFLGHPYLPALMPA